MKKTVLIFCLLTFAGKTQVNTYHPFPDSSAHWCETWSYGNTQCYTEEDYTLSLYGDTIIDSKQYHKVYSSGVVFLPQCPYPPVYHYNKYYGGYREDVAQKKVYNTSENLIYDFSLVTGNPVPNWMGGSSAIITSKDSILIGSNYRKQFWVGVAGSTHADSNWYSIIEGIGSSVGLFLAPQQGPESISKLKSCEQNGMTLYNPDVNFQCNYVLSVRETPVKNNFSVFPNPGKGQFFISMPPGAKVVQITNSLGEIIHEYRVLTQEREMLIQMEDSGIFYVHVITENQTLTKKVVVCK